MKTQIKDDPTDICDHWHKLKGFAEYLMSQGINPSGIPKGGQFIIQPQGTSGTEYPSYDYYIKGTLNERTQKQMVQLDIKMPDCCYDCPLSDDSGDYPYCWALQQNRGYRFDRKTKRFPNCPLKPVEEKKEDSESDKLKDLCRVLFNRCRAVSSCDGMMCAFCGMRTECDEMHSV